MRAPCALNGLSIHYFRPCPTLRTAQDHYRPSWQARISPTPSFVLNRSNFIHYGVQSSGHALMHRFWLVPPYQVCFPPLPSQETSETLLTPPRQPRSTPHLLP